MPEMKGIIPGSFYQLFEEEQHLGSRCLMIWGAQSEHCVWGQICLVAGSIWWWDTYLQANEIPGGVTVICYHSPPHSGPLPIKDTDLLLLSEADAKGLAAHQIQGARRAQPRLAPKATPHKWRYPSHGNKCRDRAQIDGKYLQNMASRTSTQFFKDSYLSPEMFVPSITSLSFCGWKRSLKACVDFYMPL